MESMIPKDCFQHLKDCVKVMTNHKKSCDIIKIAVAVELTLGMMDRKKRRRLWNYLQRSRKAIGNKIFEDEEDLTDFLIEKDLVGDILNG